MRGRRLVLAAGAAAALVLTPVGATAAQVSPRPALVVYVPPGPEPLTVSNPTITAYVSLPPLALRTPEQKLYVTITGPAGAEKTVPAGPDACQEIVLPPLTKNGSYQVSITTEAPGSDAGGNCQGGTDARREFVVAVPDKATTASPTSVPGAPKAPASAGRGRAAATGGKAGGASIAGIDVARFEADFDRLEGKAGSAPAGEEGFESELRYTEPGERDEELGTDEESGTRRNTLGFIAGGLLALVTFLWLRCLRSEVDRRPLPG